MIHDDELDVLRAQAGDTEAFGRVLEHSQAALFRCVRGIVGQRELAEDVLQDVFVILHQKLGWLREPKLFRPWAYRIAVREAIRRVGRERRLPILRRLGRSQDDEPDPLDLAAAPEDALVPAETDELVRRLPELVAELAPKSRAVLVLHYLEELTLPEVADVLEIPVGTAKSRLAYGLDALRRRLGAAHAHPSLERARPSTSP